MTNLQKILSREEYRITVETESVNGNLSDAYVVVVYGNVNGNIKNCENVYIINGKVNGSMKDNNFVLNSNGVGGRYEDLTTTDRL